MWLRRCEGFGVIAGPQILLQDRPRRLLVAEIHARRAGAYAAGGTGRRQYGPLARLARAGWLPRLLRHDASSVPQTLIDKRWRAGAQRNETRLRARARLGGTGAPHK